MLILISFSCINTSVHVQYKVAPFRRDPNQEQIQKFGGTAHEMIQCKPKRRKDT